MGKLLRSKVKKIAANLKFENRWTMKEFGHPVRNWMFDTMQCAHVLDNRPDITGLTFQAFVRFGIPPYDEHIKPYLEAENSRQKNQIHQIPLRDLLVYNGIDSLLEYKLATQQKQEL